MFELARIMDTSVAMLDKTYGHMLPDAPNRTRRALDTFLVADEIVATGH